jgi:hypothetical protein
VIAALWTQALHWEERILIIERALIIREPWISLILSGEKTWEMRTSWTSVRGWIALARQGTNSIAGLAYLSDCRQPLSALTYDQYFDFHQIPPDQTAHVIERNWMFPWVLSDVVPFSEPIPFQSTPSAVKFVRLDADLGGLLGERVSSSPAPLRPYRGQTPSAIPEQPVAPKFEPAPSLSPIVETAEQGPVFFFEPQLAKARAVHSGGKKLTVLKGSTAMRSGSPVVKRDRPLRDELVRTGVMTPSDDEDLFVFSQDFEFGNASHAAGVVKDGNASGPQSWKNPETGQTLKDYLDRRGS